MIIPINYTDNGEMELRAGHEHLIQAQQHQTSRASADRQTCDSLRPPLHNSPKRTRVFFLAGILLHESLQNAKPRPNFTRDATVRRLVSASPRHLLEPTFPSGAMAEKAAELSKHSSALPQSLLIQAFDRFHCHLPVLFCTRTQLGRKSGYK